MTALRFHGPVLPEGETRELYVVDGLVTYERSPGAEHVVDGWIVPGLVDAHNHLGLIDGGPTDEAGIEEQAIADRDTGVLLTRDCGSPADTRWVQDREDLPRLVRAGQHIARTARYLRIGVEVEPDGLAEAVAVQAGRGDGWVKLVGDWIDREVGDLRPSFPAEAVAAAIATAHEHGAKVTAHCFGPDSVGPLLDAGIDCIEHGTGLARHHLEQMAAGGVALVPTVLQTGKFPEFVAAGRAKFPAYADRMEGLHQTRQQVLMDAYDAGVQLYVGSDGGGSARHGYLHEEIRAMAEMGIPAADVIAAASWRGREWLGFNAGLGEGDPADFVVYDRDPRADLTALLEPKAVVLRGRVYGRSPNAE
ncbi:amidohydrolase family protein [Nocardioides montaniterrae]